MDVTLIDAFDKCQYKKCLLLLNDDVNNENQDVLSQNYRANTAVCTLLNKTISHWSSDAVGSTVKELEQIIVLYHSVYPDVSMIRAEMMTLSNWIYLNLISKMKVLPTEETTLLEQCTKMYHKQLTRVITVLKFRPLNVIHSHCDTKSILNHLQAFVNFEQLLSEYSILQPLIYAGICWTTILMMTEETDLCIQCLKQLTELGVKYEHKMKMNVSGLSLIADKHSSEDVNISDLTSDERGSIGEDNMSGLSPATDEPGTSEKVNKSGLSNTNDQDVYTQFVKLVELDVLVQGLCYFTKKQWKECSDCLSKIESTVLIPQVAYLAGICHLNDGRPDSCIQALNKVTGTSFKACNVTRARNLTLMGRCYSKKGLHQCAIQMFREALQLDFDQSIALYYISQEYIALGLEDAHLEALNLLTTVLEDQLSKTKEVDYGGLTTFWTSDIFLYLHLEDSVTLPQSTYSMAKRCLQVHRYSQGAQSYLSLLSLLSEPSKLIQIANVTSVIKLPDIRVIFHEAAECLLQSHQFEDCITVCDKALESVTLSFDSTTTYHETEEDLSPFLSQESYYSQESSQASSSRKRLRSQSCDIFGREESWKDVCHHMTLTLCRADAYIGLKELSVAADLLHRAIEGLQACIGRGFDHEGAAGDPVTSQPVPKRRRTGNEEDGAIKTDRNVQIPEWENVLVDACSRFASLLELTEKHHDALHYSRIAIQISPGNSQAWFSCCRALSALSRHEESAQTWLRHRGVRVTDRRNIASELHSRKLQLRTLTSSHQENFLPGRVTSTTLIEMDIKSLEFLIKH